MPAQEGVFVHSVVSAPKGAFSRIVWRWRVVDIVVASVVAVACSLLFVVWNIAYLGPATLLTPLLPGLQGLANGPWFVAGVLAALIVRKPGAAIYGELVASVISALIGNTWGALTIVSGFVQGLGAELVFLLFAYAVWRLPVAMLAGAVAGLAGALNDLVFWYPGSDAVFSVTYVASNVVSGAVVAGLGSWLIARGLAATGALNRFASGRDAGRRV
jgi:energy-coupling factor transport system permease protein